MLTQHTNVLFTEEQMSTLLALKAEQKKSVGDLIRHAVVQIYMQNSKKRSQKDKFQETRSTAQKYINSPVTTEEIKSWIHDGHKY